MKKILILLLVFAMMFSFVACEDNGDKENNGENTENNGGNTENNGGNTENNGNNQDTPDTPLEFLKNAENLLYSNPYKMVVTDVTTIMGIEKTEIQEHYFDGTNYMLIDDNRSVYCIKNSNGYSIYEIDTDSYWLDSRFDGTIFDDRLCSYFEVTSAEFPILGIVGSDASWKQLENVPIEVSEDKEKGETTYSYIVNSMTVEVTFKNGESRPFKVSSKISGIVDTALYEYTGIEPINPPSDWDEEKVWYKDSFLDFSYLEEIEKLLGIS